MRLPTALSACALVVALLGSTPLGRAAGQVVHAVPPFATTANYAKVAGDSAKLNGRKSTLAGTPLTIPVVGADGKLPAAIGAVGPQGPKGDKGDKGDAGVPGLSGVHIVDKQTRWNTPTTDVRDSRASCPDGEVVLGSGAIVQRYNASSFLGLAPIYGIQPLNTDVLVQSGPVSGAGYMVITARAICGKVAK